MRSALDVEERLGTNWLNKLGIMILVLGIAFFLAYQLQTLGPAGKVLVGYVASAALLGSGIYFERSDRYRILARAGIGGGWALLFFTTYAMYHVPAAHILSSQVIDLLLMLLVAGAMVAHTLRYNSQVVTGLSFLLAFATVFVSRVSVYSLTAGVVLALGMVFIALRRRWFELEIFGILASYINHWFWLRPIIEPMGSKHRPFPEFVPSAAILIAYWVLYRISHVLRRAENQRQENFSTIAALLNTVLLLAVLKYQSVRPELAFWTLLAIGSIELLVGQLPITRRRRAAFVVLTSIGAALLVAAIPFRYSGADVSILWVMEAEALFLAGAWLGELVFVRLGTLAGVAAAGHMIAVDAAMVLGRRFDGADLSPAPRLGLLVFLIAAAVFYANSHVITRRSQVLGKHWFDRLLMSRLSHVAGIIAFVGLWIALPQYWTVVAWSALGLLLAIIGKRFTIPELRIQANLLGAAAVIRVLAINLGASARLRHVSLRLITIAAVALLLYATSRFTGIREKLILLRISDAYTWTASALIALLLWYELQPISVALGWCLLGLVLFEVGLNRRVPALRWQAYVAFLAAFSRIFVVNFNAELIPGDLSPRVYTVIPLAFVFFYAYARLRQDINVLVPRERSWHVVDISCWLGTLTVAALMRFELNLDWIVAGWAILVLALLAIGWRSGLRVFLHQGLLLACAVAFRGVFHNFYTRTYFPAAGWNGRMLCVGTAVALLFASLAFAFPLRQLKTHTEVQGRFRRLLAVVVNRPDQVLFFLPLLLLTVLLGLEMRSGMITTAWGLEAVAVFFIALWAGERSFRLSALGLLLLCVGKIVAVDVWGLNPRDRYLTFIVLGSALLLVSFLYTRHRETIRRYL